MKASTKHISKNKAIKLLIQSLFCLVLITLSMNLAVAQITTSKEFLVDFGGSTLTSGTGWNNLTTGRERDGINGLKDINGNSSNINLQITDSFWQQSPGDFVDYGTKRSTVYPASATRDCFIIGNRNGFNDPTAGVRLSGLNLNSQYTIRLYASRMAMT